MRVPLRQIFTSILILSHNQISLQLFIQSDDLHKIEIRSRERIKKQIKKGEEIKQNEKIRLYRLSGFCPVAPIRPQLGRHCYVNGGRLGGIILGWAVGNDVIIFQHQYPRVDGAQLINHFVSGGVRYYIHIRQRRGLVAWRNESVRHPDSIYRGAHSRIIDHGSSRIIAMCNCRRMG